MRLLRLLPVLLAGTFLAGCLDPTTIDPGQGLETSLRPASAMEYVCPPGRTTNIHGVCVGRIVRQTESQVEPYVAIHPTNPNIVAIGTNAKHTVDSVALVGTQVQARQGQMDFFFTEDGGASWRQSVLPHVSVPGMNPTPVQVGFAGDPALEFAPDGTLHVSALVVSPIRGTSGGTGLIDVIYTSTKDLGRTWSEPVVFTKDGRNDRNWITLGSNNDIYVPWQKGFTSDVAWSLDMGASWKKLEPSQWPGSCPTASIVVVHEADALFACAGETNNRLSGIRIQALDPARGTLTQRANLTELPCIWPQLERVADGSIVLIAESCQEGDTFVNELRLSRSTDGGHTWSKPVKLTPQTKSRVDITMWMRADPWGGLHVLATQNYANLEHVLVDPQTLQVIWSKVIRPGPASPEPTRGVPEGFPVISGGDHYYGLAFTKDGAFAAWARNYGVDYASLKPVFPAIPGTQPTD